MRNLLSSLFAGSNNVRSTSSMKETASMIRSNNMPRRGFGLRSLVAAMAVVFASFSSTRASDITFNFSTLTSGQSSYVMTSGIYNLTLSNPVNSGSSGVFRKDSDGIWLGNGATFVSSAGFDMTVTGGSLQFNSYVIGYRNGGTTGTFSLNGGTGTSTGNTLVPAGTYTFAGTKIMNPGDTVTLAGTFTAGTNVLSEIKSITFSTVTVPEPSTYALGAIASGVIAVLARRRKSKLVKSLSI